MPTFISKENDLTNLLAIQTAINRSTWDTSTAPQEVIQQRLPLLSEGTKNIFEKTYAKNHEAFAPLRRSILTEFVNDHFSLSSAQEQNNKLAMQANSQKPENSTHVASTKSFLSSMHQTSKALFSAKPTMATVVPVEPIHEYAILLSLQNKIAQQKKTLSSFTNMGLFLAKDSVALFESLSVKTQQAFRTEFLNEHNLGFKPGKAEDFLKKTELELANSVGYEKSVSRSTTPDTDRTSSEGNDNGIRMSTMQK